jgi:sugar lactone lactonase YvrE
LPSTFLKSGNIDGNDRLQFWVNSATGEVILVTAAQQLWSTVDDGAHWSKVTLPNDIFAAPDGTRFVTGGPTTSAHLTICGIFFNPTQLYCTSDVGRTWNELASPVADYSGADVNLLGIGPDGSVYIFNSFNSANRSNQTMAIYRLPPGATKGSDWQRMGAVPENTPDGAFCESVCSAFPSGQKMIFWLRPSTATTDSGTFVQPNYYVATYP